MKMNLVCLVVLVMFTVALTSAYNHVSQFDKGWLENPCCPCACSCESIELCECLLCTEECEL